jgi:DNA-binding transcriptional LysR family regulator
MKHRLQRLLQGRVIRSGLHDVRHAIPPFAHHVEFRQTVHMMIVGARKDGKKVVGTGIEEDAVIAHAGLTQCINQLGPDLLVPALVFLAHAGVEHHPESDCLHCDLSPVLTIYVSGRFLGEASDRTIIPGSIASQSVVGIGRSRNRIARLPLHLPIRSANRRLPMSQTAATVALVNRLKFKHLALLVALDDARNLHQAADAVNVAQPSASRMLGDIEEAFGFLLFERNARGMTPTPLGVVTLAYARRALAELTRFAEDLDVKRKGGHGQLTVGAIMGAAPDLLAMAVATLKTERPLLNVRILGETSDQVVQLLHRREVDLALGRLTNPLQHNDFSFEPLARETLLLVVRTAHPLAQRTSITLRELIDWPWVAQPLTSPARVLFEEELARAGLATPVNLTECASIFATLQLLENYDAVAMLPESVVRDHVRGKLLVALPVEIGKSLAGFGILTRKEEPLAEPALHFIDLLRNVSLQLARDAIAQPHAAAAGDAVPLPAH